MACSLSAMRISGCTTFMGSVPSSPGGVRKVMSSASPNAAYSVTFLPFAPFLVFFSIMVSATNILGRATRRCTSSEVRASSVALMALMPFSNTLAPIAQ